MKAHRWIVVFRGALLTSGALLLSSLAAVGCLDTGEGSDPATAPAEAELSRITDSYSGSVSQSAGEGSDPADLLPGPGGGDGCCGIAKAGMGGCSICCNSGIPYCGCGGDACTCRCD